MVPNRKLSGSLPILEKVQWDGFQNRKPPQFIGLGSVTEGTKCKQPDQLRDSWCLQAAEQLGGGTSHVSAQKLHFDNALAITEECREQEYDLWSTCQTPEGARNSETNREAQFGLPKLCTAQHCWAGREVKRICEDHAGLGGHPQWSSALFNSYKIQQAGEQPHTRDKGSEGQGNRLRKYVSKNLHMTILSYFPLYIRNILIS